MNSLYQIANEGDLHELLESYNEAGDVNGLALPSRDATGSAFLASLADDGDSTHVEYIYVNDTGRAHCSSPDCPLYDEDPPWSPVYPVTLMLENPLKVPGQLSAEYPYGKGNQGPGTGPDGERLI